MVPAGLKADFKAEIKAKGQKRPLRFNGWH
jgi:hypothetical protein